MRSGRLRHRVIIQAATASRSESGAYVESWAEVDTVWADVRMVSGQERFASQASSEQAAVDYRVRMRFREDVTPSHRLLYGDQVLDIESALDPDGKGRELVCFCRVNLDG